MQEFAIQAEEASDAQMRSLVEEFGQELNQYELSTSFLGENLESKLQCQTSESSTSNYDFEAE